MASGPVKVAMKHPGVESFILATPHSLHAEQIKTSAAAKKHIFCERPHALTKMGAEFAVDACKKNKPMVGIGHERRWEPPLAKMLEMGRNGDQYKNMRTTT